MNESIGDAAPVSRGRLKIFFGAAAGVGKTYAMLEAARIARAAGAEVVVGFIQTHGRPDTERLLAHLEHLPALEVRHQGLVRKEFDLDAALARRPAIVLVDELAHANLLDALPAPRHARRWRDIEELLTAGIDVWTTVNVEHLESLNDVVAGITGIRQHETVPDRLFDDAAEIALIDLPPTDLLARLKAGNITGTDPAAAAQFFSESHLIALRELALRRTADRVNAAARAHRSSERASKPWLARDRFLIAVAPDEQAERLVRVGKRFADALDAEWIVVSVETPAMQKLGETARNRRVDVLRLAESLGAQTVTLDGPSVSVALTDYARLRNIARIVVGEPRRLRIKSLFRSSTATQLVECGGGFDISVIARQGPSPAVLSQHDEGAHPVHWMGYGIAMTISTACTLLAAVMYPYFELANLVMVYLLGATVCALRLGRGPASLSAVLNILAFDYFFVPPRYAFAVANLEYLVTFAVMLVVTLTIANLVASVGAQTRVAGARERRTALLYGMSRELAATRSLENLAAVAVRHVAETFASAAVVLVPDAQGRLHRPRNAPIAGSFVHADLGIAQWVFEHSAAAGLGTDTQPAVAAQYLPLVGSGKTLGVLAVEPAQRRRLLLPEQRNLIETFAGQIALALERAVLADEAEASRITAETESLRNTLLSSISHDLRTPLSVIAGASSALNDPTMKFDQAAHRLLTASIESKANEMSAIISNVLDLMRLESGNLSLRRDWQTVDDLVGSALARLKNRLAGHPVEVDLANDLPPVNVDDALLIQVLGNLLENAAKHTPLGTRIIVSAALDGALVRIFVDDTGPSLPAGDPERLFVKFQRGRDESNTGGAGLGLAICRAIVDAHGGRIAALQRPGGGARFTFTLPTE